MVTNFQGHYVILNPRENSQLSVLDELLSGEHNLHVIVVHYESLMSAYTLAFYPFHIQYKINDIFIMHTVPSTC